MTGLGIVFLLIAAAWFLSKPVHALLLARKVQLPLNVGTAIRMRFSKLPARLFVSLYRQFYEQGRKPPPLKEMERMYLEGGELGVSFDSEHLPPDLLPDKKPKVVERVTLDDYESLVRRPLLMVMFQSVATGSALVVLFLLITLGSCDLMPFGDSTPHVAATSMGVVFISYFIQFLMPPSYFTEFRFSKNEVAWHTAYRSKHRYNKSRRNSDWHHVATSEKWLVVAQGGRTFRFPRFFKSSAFGVRFELQVSNGCLRPLAAPLDRDGKPEIVNYSI
ncbi:MAG: hypothetical protein AAFQ65_03835 [Myxococcota bacterium]